MRKRHFLNSGLTSGSKEGGTILERAEFRPTFKLVILGSIAGVGLTINAAFISRTLIYGIGPLNPPYLSGGVLLIGLIALLASSIPAIRDGRIDPVRALRTEQSHPG